MTTARQLAVKLDAPMVNDLGFSKRYVRCLQVLLPANIFLSVNSYHESCELCLILTATEDWSYQIDWPILLCK